MAKDSEGEYARILRRLVDDPDYGEHTPPAKLVWLTMLMAAEFKVLGIATLDVPVMARRTGYSNTRVEKALAELEAAEVIRRHGAWCWIRNHLRFQEGSEAWAKSSKTMTGLSSRLNNLPSGLSFLPEFVQMYRRLGFNFDLAPRLQARLDILIDRGIGTGIDNPETETPEPETPETPEPDPIGAHPAHRPNPLVDRAALVREGHALITEIAKRENLDPTEVARKATEYKGRGHVRIDILSDDRLAHSVADLREWKRRLDGTPSPQAKPPTPPPEKRQSMDAKNTDAIKRAIERRLTDAGPGQGNPVPEGVVTDRKSLPPGS